MWSFNSTVLTPSPLDYSSPYTFTDSKSLEFVGFCLLFGVALLFYLAGSPYFIGWLSRLILKRFILSKLLLDEDSMFDIGTVSIAWLSGTIFAHKIEIRTQQFVLLIVELRLSFFWWTNHIRSNDSFKELMDDNKPYRVQLKLVGLECILYANKSRFDELRNIVESQRHTSLIEQDIEHKSPSIHTLKSSPHSVHQNKNDDLVDVSLGDDVVETYVVESGAEITKTRESVTMSVDEHNELLNKNKIDNVIIRQLKKHIEQIAPHWLFELCPVTRIGLEKVCVVIGNLNVENYLVGSFKDIEMLCYTEKNDVASTIHPFKYAVIGKMWDANVRFTKNDDFSKDLKQRLHFKEDKKIAVEADYITDSIYLFDKLLPDATKKKKKIQIGELTKESLQINADNIKPHQYMLNQYKTMREIQENSPVTPTKNTAKKKKRKKEKEKEKNKKKKTKSNKKNKNKNKKSIKKNTNPLSEGAAESVYGYGYNMVATTRPPSTKTGASSVTTNDDNKTFITHSSHYTHSSQRSHQPYTYYHTRHHNRHTTQTTDSGETISQTTDNDNNISTLNVPGTTGITIKIQTEPSAFNSNPNSPHLSGTPISFIPRAYSDVSQPQIIIQDIGDKGTVTTDQQSSVGTGPFGLRHRTNNSLRPPTVTTNTINSSDFESKEETKYSGSDPNPNLEDDADREPQDPDSMHIIHIDSFSFFFQRDSPAQLTNLHLDNVRALDGLNETILPQQKFEIVVHNEFIVNYGPYADDLRAKLMTNFLPFMYQHRSLTSLIPSQIGDYFSFNALDIIIKFDEPRFPINNHTEQYSDSASSINSDGMKSKAPSNHDNIPWFIFNIPFSANIPDEAKQLDEGEVIDNHLMQIKFGANSLIKISIPWIISDLDTKCDYTTIDLSLTPCNISSSIRKSELYHSIIDTDKFVMKYKWTTPQKWNDLQKHEIDINLIKIDRISKVFFLSEHINVFKSLSSDWFNYRPEVTIQYFVPSTTCIKLKATDSEIVTSINEFNVIHINNSPLLNVSDEFLDNPCNARLKWKGIVDLELNLPSTDWKPSVSNMNIVLEMRSGELYLELPAEHPFTDMMPNKKRLSNDYCLKFKKCTFEMNYIYHLVYYREYRDSMNISIHAIDPEFKIYGHFMRYYWNFIQNYSSVFSEFLTMEEFRNEYKYNNTTLLDKRKKLQNIKDQKINSFEVYTQINIANASLILPSSIIGSTNNTNYQQKMMNSKSSYTAKIKFEELMFDFRSTDQYNNMYIHSSPIRCMIPLTEQEQSNTKSMHHNINTFLSIDSFVLKRQGWNGLPPEYLTYSQAIDGDIGKIKVQLFDCQFERLIHTINAFILQYKNSFDSRCFDFREKENLISTTNDNPDQIDYPSKELSIMNINFDIKSIDISIHHNINMFRYQHITRCICPYGIQIKSSSESTLEFAQKTVINCHQIELQHLISTKKPNAFNLNKEEEKTEEKTRHAKRGRNRRSSPRDARNRAQTYHQRSNPQRKQSRQRPAGTNRRGKNQRKKSQKNKSSKVKDDLLCVGSLDSHFQIILTTERSDQEIYHSKQRNFENRQEQQTEDDVEMDQDWPVHLLNTMYMQLPKQRSPNRNTKTIPMYQQTELEYELYGRHSDIRVKNRKKQSLLNADKIIEEVNEDSMQTMEASPVVHNLPNPFEDGSLYDETDHNQEESTGTGLALDDQRIATTADEDTDCYFSAEEIKLKSPQPTFKPTVDTDVHVHPDIKTSYLTTPSPDASFVEQKPPHIETATPDNDENYQTLSMKRFHVSNYMEKYQKEAGPTELGTGWKKPRHIFHVNADYIPLPEISYQITTPSLLRKYMNNSNMMTPRPGIGFGWDLQVSPRRLQQQTATENTLDNDDKSTLDITYRTHVNIADNTSIVITPEFLDSIHVYMRVLQPKTHSLSEVLDEMQEFVCDFYDGTYSPHYDRNRHQHAGHSRISQNTPTFDQFRQKKIISATIGTIHLQSLERAEGAPGIFLLDTRISHISIEHSKSYAGTPWKTVVGDIENADTIIHFANASFQGFKAAPSVDRSNGMPVEIKEWGHVLDPSLLFETENTEYFVGIEMTDSCVRRTQYMIKNGINKEEEKEPGVCVIPSENMINVKDVKVSTSSTAFANIATLVHRFGRYANKISQEIPWQNALKMDRLKLVTGEMLTAVSSLQNIKSSQPWHRHFLEWLYFRIKSHKRKHAIKEAIWEFTSNNVITSNNYTRASGIAFMVIVRNLTSNLGPRVERKLKDGFLNVAQQYLDPQYLYSRHNTNTNNYNNRYNQNAKMDTQHIGRKRYLFAAQKEQFYPRRADEFGSSKRIANPIIRQCYIELTKELSKMFFPKQNTNQFKYKESTQWNISKTSFEVIQDHEKSCTMYASQFRGFLKIQSSPPQEFKEDSGVYTVTISTTIKKVISQAKPASLDALFSLNNALNQSKQDRYQQEYQQQYYKNNMYRFGSLGYEPYLIPPSYNTAASNNIGSTHKSSAVFRALRYSKPGHNTDQATGDNMKYHYHSNVHGSTQRWVTKIHCHIKCGEIRASVSTPECADLDIQIMKLSLVSNRSILPPPINQSGNITNTPQQHHGHSHSHHSSGSSSFSGFRDEYHHILVNLWKMDARLLLAVELDDVSSGGHSMATSTMSTFDDRQVIFELGIREGTMSVSSIPSFTYDTNHSNNDSLPQRAYSTSSVQIPTTKSSTSIIGNTTKTPNEPTPSTPTPSQGVKTQGISPNANKTPIPGGKTSKTTTTSSGSYVEQVAIAINAEKCVSQILFDRILDSKSDRKRLDIKQLVEPWLDFVQQHIKKNGNDAMKNPNYGSNWDYNEPVEVQPRAIHLIANLDHFKFRSWLSEKCVCIYTLESITSHLVIKPNRNEYVLSIEAGKNKHKFDFIIYKVPQRQRILLSRRMEKDIQSYIHNPHIASINTQKFPFVLTRIITKKESQTAPLRNPSNDQIYEKYASFDIGSVADEDELFEKSEKVTIVTTIALSKMSAEVSEKMFGSLIRLYSRLRNEASTVIKVYEEIANSVSKIKHNLIGKQHSPDHTVLTKSGYFPQTTIQVNIAFEGVDANISLTDHPNVGAVAKSGPLNLRVVYNPEYLPIRSDKIALMLNSADHLSLEVWDEMNEENDDNAQFQFFESKEDGIHDGLHMYDDYERNDSDSDIGSTSSGPFTTKYSMENEEDEDILDENNNNNNRNSKHIKSETLKKTMSGTRIVINDQLYTAPAKRVKPNLSKKGNKKSRKHKLKKSISKSNINNANNDDDVRTILPLHIRSNIKITAFVQRVRNQWNIKQDINLKQTQIQLTPSVITVLKMLMFNYQEEFRSTVTTNVIQEIDELKRAVMSRIPTMQNISSGHADDSNSGNRPDHEMSTLDEHDNEFGAHLSWTNTNTVVVSKAASNISATSSQKKHNNNIVKPPNTDQLSVPGLSPTAPAGYRDGTAFSFHSGTTKHDNKTANGGIGKRVKHKAQQMVETEAIDVRHIYLTSMVSMKNFLCVAVLGENHTDRPLLSTSINNRHDGSLSNQCQFISVYCQEAQCGIKSNDLYTDTKSIKVTTDIRASNVIAGLDEKINTEKLWKIEKYQHFENLFLNRWRFIEFDMRNEFKITSKYFIKSNIVVSDILSLIQPNMLQLIINIADNIGDVNDFGNGLGVHGTELIGGGDKTANNSNEVNMTGQNIRKRSPNWDLDINFEWRGGKLSLKDNNTIISLPYIKLFSSVIYSAEQIESDTFVLINFDKISLDMHFLQFVGSTIECLNIATDQRDINIERDAMQNNINNDQQQQRVSNHTLCVSIANLNTTLSCQPIYDKLECVFNVNDPISICWCQSSLQKKDLDAAYTDIVTISIPKVSMKIIQKYHLMTQLRFDLDIQRAKGLNVRNDGLPIITTLISLEKVVVHTSALGIITTNLFLKCIQKELSKYFMTATRHKLRRKLSHNAYDPHSPSQRIKHITDDRISGSYRSIATGYRTLFCIKDKLKFICDLSELPLINTHIKVGLDQVAFEYQDDGRLDRNGGDHLIRAILRFRGVIECSERIYNKQHGGHKQQQQQPSVHSASSMLGTIMNLANITNQNEPGSSWKRKHGALIKKLEPLQGKFQMNDVMTISFLHHFNRNQNNIQIKSFQINDTNPFDAEKLKRGINRLQIVVPQTNILLKTLTLRRIIEVNTTSAMHIEVQDSPNNNNEFAINIVLELEEGIVLRLAPHSIPYLLSTFYTISEFMKREQNDIIAHLQDNKETNDGDLPSANDVKSMSNPSQTHINSLSESVFNRYYLHRGLSPLSWKSHLSSTDFFGPNDASDTPLFVIGSFELKARSVGLILYVDNNQKNNYVRLHLNHFRFIFNRECKEYLEDENTQLIEDDVNVYFGKKDDIKHGLYVVPIQYILDPNSLKNDGGSTKDLIAVPLCHIHYNAKTNIDDASVTDIFEAKWGNQTFILPLDLRPFDNIGKTFKKYHRDYKEIIIKHKIKHKHKHNNNNNNNNNIEDDDESLKTIKEKEEQNDHHHQKSQSSSISSSSKRTFNQIDNNNKRTFNHDKYQFEPPFPSVKYIVSAETILEKLGIKTPQNTIPQSFYLSCVEPISTSFGIVRAISMEIDEKLSPISHDQQ